MRSDAEENTIAGQHARPSVVERHLQRFRRHKTARPHDQFGASSCSSADAVLFRGQPCRVCVCERPPCRSVNASSRPFRPLTRKCDGAGGSPILPKAGFTFRRYSRMSALRAKADLRHSAGNEVHTSRFLIASKQVASVTHLKAKSLRLVCERMQSPGHVARLLFGLRG